MWIVKNDKAVEIASIKSRESGRNLQVKVGTKTAKFVTHDLW